MSSNQRQRFRPIRGLKVESIEEGNTMHLNFTLSIRNAVAAAFLLLSCFYSVDSSANALNVSPLRLDVTPGSRTTSLSLRNLINQELPVQIKAYSWSQVDGEDVLEPTRDLIFSPPIVKISAYETQIVRFRLRRGADKSQQRNYRIFVEQLVPENEERPRGSAFRIRFSLPLFVHPLREAPAPQLAVKVGDLGDGKFNVTVENTGNAHLRMMGVALYPGTTTPKNIDVKNLIAYTGSGDKGSTYLLQNSSKTWTVDAEQRLKTGVYNMVMITDFFDGRDLSNIGDDGSYWHPIRLK